MSPPVKQRNCLQGSSPWLSRADRQRGGTGSGWAEKGAEAESGWTGKRCRLG